MNKIFFTEGDIENLQNSIIKQVKELVYEQQETVWLRTSDAVSYLNCNNSTLINLRKQGILPFYKLGGTVYYKKEDIDKVIEGTKTVH